MGDLNARRTLLRGLPLSVAFSLVLVVVSALHAAEDFAYGQFGARGIGPIAAAFALGAIYALQALGAYLAGARRKTGFALLGAAGAVWAIGAVLIHGGEVIAHAEFRAGLASRLLVAAVIVLGAAVAAAAAQDRLRTSEG